MSHSRKCSPCWLFSVGILYKGAQVHGTLSCDIVLVPVTRNEGGPETHGGVVRLVERVSERVEHVDYFFDKE
jgi:hypothetical protein